MLLQSSYKSSTSYGLFAFRGGRTGASSSCPGSGLCMVNCGLVAVIDTWFIGWRGGKCCIDDRSSDLMRGFVRIRFFPTLSRRCTETIDTSALESIIHVVGLALSITSVVAEMPFLWQQRLHSLPRCERYRTSETLLWQKKTSPVQWKWPQLAKRDDHPLETVCHPL